MRQYITQPHRISLAVTIDDTSEWGKGSAYVINIERSDIVSIEKKKENYHFHIVYRNMLEIQMRSMINI